jgi:competence protein ComEA
MSGSQRRIVIILTFALIIFGFSFYEFIGKKVETETPPPVLVADAENTQEDLVVYVSGAVNKPGVFKAPPKSRVIDAVNTAGGFSARADEEKINLAELLQDGQHINVPSKIKPANSVNAQEIAAAAYSNLININTATEKELQDLPGIGPAMSKRIVEYRENNGSFQEISELRKVSGIGEKRFKDLEDKVTL